MENDFDPFGTSYQDHLKMELKLIENIFPDFHCKIHGSELVVFGVIKPNMNSQDYAFRLNYIAFNPRIWIIEPKIQYNNEIHMYSDSSLCLYDPRKGEWDPSNHVYSLIPWISEWLIFYELYLINGVWLHPEAEHFQPKQL